MKIVCISDTHAQHRKFDIPDGDVLVFAGDIMTDGWAGHEIRDFNTWLGELPHKHKIVIAGNHDRRLEMDYQTSKEFFTNAIYLQDTGTVIDGFKFWGSPYTPEFCNWAFNARRGEDIQSHWDKIPKDVDVLITHGPPLGRLDKTGGLSRVSPGVWLDQSLGCADLAKTVDLIRPQLHIFGHIHGGYGKTEVDGTLFVNAALVDETYRPKNEPIIVEV